jgi:integration host factor subunit beta
MTKSELIEKITMKLGTLTHPKVEVAVNSIIELMSESLDKGQHIEVRGFGSFTLKTMKARVSRNPKTGAPVELEQKVKVHFKPGKELKERVNASA